MSPIFSSIVNRTGFQDWLRNSLDWRTSRSKAATRFSNSSIGLVLIASSHITIVRHNRDITLSRSADCMFLFIGTSITIRGLLPSAAFFTIPVPLPGKLVHQIIEWLYRENRFCSNELKIGGKFIGPSTLPVPTLAVVNTADDVAPLNSLKPFADA